MEDFYTSSAPDTRFKNTAQVEIPETKRGENALKFIVEDVLAVCGIKPADMFCIPEFYNRGVYELVFKDTALYKLFRKNYLAKKDDPRIAGCNMEFKHRDNIRMVTVVMYNTYVTDSEILFHLDGILDEVEMVKKITNEYGIWTGKRLFRVRLRDDESSEDGFDHPDQLINISGNRGFLKYNGMPLFCWKCHDFGHVSQECNVGKICRVCGELGHDSEDCQRPRMCSNCGKEGHRFMECPIQTYAERVKAGVAPPPKENIREVPSVLSVPSGKKVDELAGVVSSERKGMTVLSGPRLPKRGEKKSENPAKKRVIEISEKGSPSIVYSPVAVEKGSSDEEPMENLEKESGKGGETPTSVDSCGLLMETEGMSGEDPFSSPMSELGSRVMRGGRLSETPVLPTFSLEEATGEGDPG